MKLCSDLVLQVNIILTTVGHSMGILKNDTKQFFLNLVLRVTQTEMIQLFII